MHIVATNHHDIMMMMMMVMMTGESTGSVSANPKVSLSTVCISISSGLINKMNGILFFLAYYSSFLRRLLRLLLFLHYNLCIFVDVLPTMHFTKWYNCRVCNTNPRVR